MNDVLSKFRRWFYRTLHSHRVYAVESCEDAPDLPTPFVLYLIGDARHPWSASFVCPCGCRETIALSLIEKDNPSWRVRRHRDGTTSLFPSIWRIKGCRSHFFLRNSRIAWARSTNRHTTLRRSD